MKIYECEKYINDLEIATNSTVEIDKLRNKTILVTGATGTIGSFLVDMLIHFNRRNANIRIIAAGRDEAKIYKSFPTDRNLVAVKYDLFNKIDFDVDVDYIIHAAGNAHPVAFNSDPVGTIVGNVNSTYNLLEYGRQHGCRRFCYVSSGEIYGLGDVSIEAYEESYAGYLDTCMPRTCYPISKRTAENLCASYYKQYGLETVIVRPCHTYGPRFTESDSRANVQFFRNVLQGKDITMTSPGTQLRSYCYIADCASAIFTCLINGAPGQAYNSANPLSRVTIAEMARTIAKCSERRVVFSTPDAEAMSHRSPIEKQVLSSDKLESLGWKGKYSIEMGVQNTLTILSECS